MKIFLSVFLFVALLVKPFGVDGQAGTFDIVDPGPQAKYVYFNFVLTNARDASNNLRNGPFQVEISTINPSPLYRTLFLGSATFDEGETTISIRLPNTDGTYNTQVIVNDIETKTILLTTDLSNFTLGSPGIQTAGTPFSPSITGAKDYYNIDLTGSHNVTISTSNTLEGTGGLLFSGAVTFSGGAPTIAPQITLTHAGNQTLTVTVAGITDPETGGVTVNAAAASKLVILQQPISVAGNYNDSPVTLSTINLQTQDAYNNPSTAGFSGVQNVIATIASNPGGAVLGGTVTLDIQSGSASFTSITADTEGAYTLNFASTSPASLTSVTTNSFNVSQLNNLSEFTISTPADASTQYQNVDFQMQLTGAKTNTGANLTGTKNVTVSSSSEGIVYNNSVTFTAGAANLTLALGNLGAHTLTVSVEGVDTNETLGLTVSADNSGFTLTNPGGSPQLYGVPFNLSITAATNYANSLITGNAIITVVSSISGTVYNSSTSITGGIATVPVTLNSVTTHNLTVTIAGITGSEVITGLVVDGDLSAFTVAGTSTSAQTAGVNSDIILTGALATNGSDLTGMRNVTIVSSIVAEGAAGTVFNQDVNFIDGDASTTINLEVAATHNLTITVGGVTASQPHQIVVSAAAASQLVITQQPVGGSGNYDGVAINIGTVIVQTQDAFGNVSTSGLASPQNISISLANNPGGATLTGTATLNAFATGIATFNTLKLNKNGVGYTLSISSSGFTTVTSDPFTITNVLNLSGFEIVPPGPQVIDVPFNLQIINAKNAMGVSLDGSYTVQIIETAPGSSVPFPSAPITFTSGSALVPISLSSEGNYTFLVTIGSNIQNSFTTVVATDASDMVLAIDPVGNQTAGTPFDLDITGALAANGVALTGNHAVTITSSNTSEGIGGVLFSGNLDFTSIPGSATKSLTLLKSSLTAQTLTVTIDWVKTPETINVTVNPNTATQFLITQQPSATVNGINNNAALSIGTVILQSQDAHGNISTIGLSGTQTVSVEITGNPVGVTLGGTLTDQDISTNGTVSFGPLSLDKNGVYTLSFTYNGTTPTFTPNPAVTNTITMTNVEDLSGFDVAPDLGTNHAEIPFNLNITNAQGVTGAALAGSINVTVSSSISGTEYNSATTFTAGSASISLSLPVGTHDLTVAVTGVTISEVHTGLVVVANQSDFTLGLTPSGGPFYNFEAFTLDIIGAKDLDGFDLSGNINVTITSNQADGEVYNLPANFIAGAAHINLVLETVANHTLTVDVSGVTASKTIAVNVLDNTSDFSVALNVAGDKTAGSSFDLAITAAQNSAAVLLNGSGYHVTVTSNQTKDGMVFDSDVAFTSGVSDLINISLDTAVAHILTVQVESILPTKTVGVTVIPANASKLVITQQPTGGAGTGNDAAAALGTVIIRTYDAFDNPSITGLNGTQEVTASISNNPSYEGTAALGGTTTLNISSGTASFNNLTLDMDGIGYTLLFAYSGDPVLTSVTSNAFNMTSVNAYTISITDESLVTLDDLNPKVFATQTIPYTPITAEAITVTRTGVGAIQALAVGLTGAQAGSFTITQPLVAILDGTPQSTTFTLKPNDGLAAGTYSATVTVTASNVVSESFTVSVQILAAAAISLNAVDPTVFASVTEGYPQVSDVTVTISNTGGGNITGLNVALSGTNPSAFVAGAPLLTTIASGANTTFTIRPENSLAVGTYTATVTVNNDQLVPQSFDVSFTVIAYTYSISLTAPGNVDFGLVAEGYNPAPAAVTKTITRLGTGPIDNIVISLSGGVSSNFDITQPTPDSIFVTPNSTTFTVRPKTGLTANTYTETVTVAAANMTSVIFDVTIMVSGNVSWDGSTNNEWHTSSNWSSNSVPSQYSYITIPNTANDPVISSVNVTVNNLTIEDGALLTVTAARRLTIANGGLLTINPGGMVTISGTFVNSAGTSGLLIESNGTSSGSLIQNSTGVSATFERYMTPDTWHTLSPPVSGSIQSFITDPSNSIPLKVSPAIYGMGYYDEAQGKWVYYTSATYGGSFSSGKGYITRTDGPNNIVSFAGTLNTGDVNVSFPQVRNGWNSAGNPYSSSIAFNNATGQTNFIDVNASQFEASYAAGYFWNGTGYSIVNNVSAATYLQPGLGFIAKAKTGGGTLGFSSAQKAHNNSASFYKKSSSSWNELYLHVTTGTDSAKTKIAFREDMTRGLDVTYDAGLFGGNTNFLLYSKLVSDNGINFALQCLSSIETDSMVIPIGFDCTIGGLVSFSAEITSLPINYISVLEDRHLGIFTDLSEHNSKYEIVVDAETKGTGRFYLHTVAGPNGINLQANQKITTFAVKKEIYIKGKVSENAVASVFDLMGRKIADYNLEPTDINIIDAGTFERGIYILRVSDRGVVKTDRIYISD